MRYFVDLEDGLISIRYNVGEEGALGEGFEVVCPGESFLGMSYEHLRAQGEGAFEIDDAAVRAFLDSVPA